ncbi:hypothetical protein [Nocardia miyunensis]|uniref:hypothetical protein n=1 Tax=Nocardia miyunensis TaxID=282684 RepID=UPI00082A0BBC|nr:hypothetical protein [Nocardia miyunensis]
MNSIPLAHTHTASPLHEGRAPVWPALTLAALMFAAAAACVPWLQGWATDYGAILVYWALALHLAIAIGLVRWAVRTRRTDYRSQRY